MVIVCSGADPTPHSTSIRGRGMDPPLGRAGCLTLTARNTRPATQPPRAVAVGPAAGLDSEALHRPADAAVSWGFAW